jgi:hypothetical protein
MMCNSRGSSPFGKSLLNSHASEISLPSPLKSPGLYHRYSFLESVPSFNPNYQEEQAAESPESGNSSSSSYDLVTSYPPQQHYDVLHQSQFMHSRRNLMDQYADINNSPSESILTGSVSTAPVSDLAPTPSLIRASSSFYHYSPEAPASKNYHNKESSNTFKLKGISAGKFLKRLVEKHSEQQQKLKPQISGKPIKNSQS